MFRKNVVLSFSDQIIISFLISIVVPNQHVAQSEGDGPPPIQIFIEVKKNSFVILTCLTISSLS